ncbi:hypothetical protein AAKU61_003041 [Undibacterium sp. GrIS 1.2]|uniref:DUF2515 family protein n=1 Tax=Undibacterium sp. GrIS 1.2 TaxID=3143933 RepID=UPI003390C072
MADPTTVEATTNVTLNSRVEVKCDCNTMWSLAQQFSTMRLCTHTGVHKGQLVEDYAVRARRIAATYARFYLEQEEGGSPDKKGRFYWMALGAFASKTVACTFEVWQVKGLSMVTKTVWDGLGKGNLWLFCDISGWHWYYSRYQSSFTMCLPSRNANNYVKPVKIQMNHLPWKNQALPVIKNMQVSKEIQAGFAKVKQFEEETQEKRRPSIQFSHLLDIANHEQGVILQPLIYDDPAFAGWVQRQRSWYANWASPPLQLVFTHACDTEKPELKSVAPEGTKLEVFASRMSWIRGAAQQFHQLMQRNGDLMENELRMIASWVDMPDKT